MKTEDCDELKASKLKRGNKTSGSFTIATNPQTHKPTNMTSTLKRSRQTEVAKPNERFKKRRLGAYTPGFMTRLKSLDNELLIPALNTATNFRGLKNLVEWNATSPPWPKLDVDQVLDMDTIVFVFYAAFYFLDDSICDIRANLEWQLKMVDARSVSLYDCHDEQYRETISQDPDAYECFVACGNEEEASCYIIELVGNVLTRLFPARDWNKRRKQAIETAAAACVELKDEGQMQAAINALDFETMAPLLHALQHQRYIPSLHYTNVPDEDRHQEFMAKLDDVHTNKLTPVEVLALSCRIKSAVEGNRVSPMTRASIPALYAAMAIGKHVLGYPEYTVSSALSGPFDFLVEGHRAAVALTSAPLESEYIGDLIDGTVEFKTFRRFDHHCLVNVYKDPPPPLAAAAKARFFQLFGAP